MFDILKANLDFCNAVLDREETSWDADFEVITETDNMRLLKFVDGPDKNQHKQLIIPPRSGNDSTIAKVLAKLYVGRNDAVYVIDYKAATQKTKNDSYTEAIDDVLLSIDAMGVDKVKLSGLCAGGNTAQFVTALFPEKVISLITAGTPADFRIGGGKIVDAINPMSPFLVQGMITMNGGVWPGPYQILGFKMMNPQRLFVDRYVDLYKDILDENEKGVKRFKGFDAWYEKTQDLPGKFVMDVLVKFFMNNDLIKGNLRYKGRKIDLKNITCPVGVITGSKDDISSKVQCESLLDYVSSEVTYKEEIKGVGHLGIYLSSRSMATWVRTNEALKV